MVVQGQVGAGSNPDAFGCSMLMLRIDVHFGPEAQDLDRGATIVEIA